jgi:long-chain acyl-CoA synthetase
MGGRVLAALRDAPGGHLALCDEQRSFSYAELAKAVEAESDWLRPFGLRRCALLADNGTPWVIADLSLLALHALNVPLPPWFTKNQIEHVLDDAGVEFILTDQPERILRGHPEFRHCARAPHSGLALFRREAAAVRGDQSGIAKVTYTSGSTGAAKGVCLTLDAMEAVAQSLASAIRVDAARHLCAMPLSTLLENIAGVYTPILLGATCIVPSMRRTGIGYDGVDLGAFIASISRTGPNSLILPPELLRLLVVGVRRGWSPPEQLRFIAVGGATVSAALLDEANALGLPAYQGYGLSECASVVCLNTPDAARRGSVGKVLPHARVRVDEQGQILVRGATMRGYLGHDLHAADEIATGDLGEIDADGFVYVRGRLKNMFITSMGRNLSPEWIESELTRDASVGQAIVLGEGRAWPIALIQPSSAEVTQQDIERAVSASRERLPNYAQVRRWARLPRPLSFADGLLTANGRPRRELIAARYASLVDELYQLHAS